MIPVQDANERLSAAGEAADVLALIDAGDVKADRLTRTTIKGDSARSTFRVYGVDTDDWPQSDEYSISELSSLAGVEPDKVRGLANDGVLESVERQHFTVSPDSLEAYINREIRLGLDEVRERLDLSKSELCEAYLRGRLRVHRARASGAVRADDFYVLESDLEQYPQDVFTPDWGRAQESLELHSPKYHTESVAPHIVTVVQHNSRGPSHAWGMRDQLGQTHAPLTPFSMSLSHLMHLRMRRVPLLTLEQFKGYLPTLEGTALQNMCELAGLDTDVADEDKRVALAERLGLSIVDVKTSFTVGDIAELCGVTERTVYRHIKEYESLPAEKVGGAYVVTRADFEAWSDEHAGGEQ